MESKEKKLRLPKVRKTWIRNPAEQIVPDHDKTEKLDKRRIKDEALEEYDELHDFNGG